MFGGRIYTLTWDAATAVSTALDVFEVDPAADKGVFVHELKMWQTSDVGDAEMKIVKVSFIRGYTGSGSGGGTTAVGKKYAGDATNGFTTECRNTTLATTGTGEVTGADGWNVLVPYIWTPTPYDMVFSPNPILVARISAPTASITMDASMIVEEIG